MTSTESYNISGSNDFSELKHLTYRNAKGVFKLKKTQLLVGGWVKIKKLTRSELKKSKKHKKNLANKSTLFTTKNLSAALVKIRRPKLGKSRKAKYTLKRQKLIRKLYKRMSLHLKSKLSKKLIYKLVFKKNIVKKLKQKQFKTYKKERLRSTKGSEINPLVSMLKRFQKYNLKKNIIKTLINPNKTLNIKALKFFNKYLNRERLILNKSLLKRNKKVTNQDRKITSNAFKTIKKTFLLKSFFKNPELRRLLLKMNKNGTKINTFTKVLKLLLNPTSFNFLLNKDFMIEDDSSLDDYFTETIVNKHSVKLAGIRPANLGYAWEEGFNMRHFYNPQIVRFDTFFENISSTHFQSDFNKVGTVNYIELAAFIKNNTVLDFTKLNLLKTFPYRSHMFSTLLKTTILNENLSSSYFTAFTDNTFLKKKLLKKSLQYSYFRKKDLSDKKNLIKQSATFYEYFKTKKYTINTTFGTEKVLLVTTKTPTLYNLGGAEMQTRINLVTENQIGLSRTGAPMFCPTVFTLKTRLYTYLTKQLFTAYANGGHANSDSFYHYPESTTCSSNIHAANNVLQTMFVLNWSENLFENSLYVRPFNIHPTTSKTPIEDKLINLLTASRYQSKDDNVDDAVINEENTLNVESKFDINDMSNLFTHVSKYFKNLKLNSKKNNKRNKKKKKIFTKLLGFIQTDVTDFIQQTDSRYSTNVLSDVLKVDDDVSDDALKIVNVIQHRLQKRFKVSRYNPQYVLFVLKPICRAWLNKRKAKRTRKLKTVAEKKKYLLFNKKKNKKRNPKFYNKIVKKETQSIRKQLNKPSKLEKKKKIIKRYFSSSTPFKWASSVEFFKNNFSIYQKTNKIVKEQIIDECTSDLISDYDDYVDEIKSMALCTKFTGFDDEEDVSSANYVAWLVDHASRNHILDSLTTRIEYRKSYRTVALPNQYFKHEHNLSSQSDYKNFDLSYYLLSNIFFLNKILSNTFLFKYLLIRSADFYNKSHYNISLDLAKPILHTATLAYFGSRFDLYQKSNLIPTESFSFLIQRRILKCFAMRKFVSPTGAWYNHMLVRFMSNCTGRRVYLKLNPHVENSLTFEDQAQCFLWENRVFGFQKILGPKIFIEESLRIILLALKYKDPTFLINWIRTMLYRMSFWKYRTLFRYLKFVIKDLFEPNFEKFGLRGFKVKLKGKISVAGNARTRTLMMRIGQTSHSKFNNKVAHSFTLVNSFTGVMGFNLWIFF